MREREEWGTADEIEFLGELGTYGDFKKNKIYLLDQYIESSKKRDRWGLIDREKVIKFAKMQLKLLLAIKDFESSDEKINFHYK